MIRTILVSVLFTACVPANPPPNYGGGGGPAQPQGGVAVQGGVSFHGRVPRGQRVDHVVAVQVDVRTGKRSRVRVRPAADGSFQMQLPRGHRYEMAYESGGQVIGNVGFPSAHGGTTNVINLSSSVVVTQNNYVDLGDVNYVNGVYVAAYDPYAYLDSDGDGIVDDQDNDAPAEDWSVEASAEGVFGGDFDDVDED